jgi:hypothetical protein
MPFLLSWCRDRQLNVAIRGGSPRECARHYSPRTHTFSYVMDIARPAATAEPTPVPAAIEATSC